MRITRASPSSTSPRASHSSASHHLAFPDELAGSSDRAGPSISFGAPADDRTSIAASGDELGSGDDDSAALRPSGRVALPESDPELTAMLSRAAESVGLHWRPPPSPKRSRLDDWFLGAQADRRQPPPVPFFPEVHEEVTRSWRTPFSARNSPSASSVLTTLDGGAAQGYVEIPPVERAIAMQLCPQGAAAWRGNPRLPSRACKFSSALTVKAYGAAGQAASALQAYSVNDSCLEFGPGNSHVVLRPRPGYVPKVPTTPFRDQVVNLQVLPREEADPRTSDQLFVYFGGQQEGKAVSKQDSPTG